MTPLRNAPLQGSRPSHLTVAAALLLLVGLAGPAGAETRPSSARSARASVQPAELSALSQLGPVELLRADPWAAAATPRPAPELVDPWAAPGTDLVDPWKPVGHIGLPRRARSAELRDPWAGRLNGPAAELVDPWAGGHSAGH